jgi:hypothetical protein
MFRNRSTRALATLGLTIILSLTAMAGPTAILGAQASADHTATPVPGAVSPGTNVAFDVRFALKSTETSTLSQLYLRAATPAGATLLGVEGLPSQGSCTSGVDLSCTFGAVKPGTVVTLRVVYTTPSSPGTFNVPFLFSTTGVAADKGKNSHGDDYPTSGIATLDASLNFGGAYTATSGQVVADNETLSKRQNPQSTKVYAPSGLIGVTVGEEPIGPSTVVCPSEAGTCFGQWSVISVDGGTPYANGFKVVLGYKGNIGNAKFVHVLDNGTVQLITAECSSATPAASEMNPGCFIISSQNGDSFVTLWLIQNGRLSGY